MLYSGHMLYSGQSRRILMIGSLAAWHVVRRCYRKHSHTKIAPPTIKNHLYKNGPKELHTKRIREWALRPFSFLCRMGL